MNHSAKLILLVLLPVILCVQCSKRNPGSTPPTDNADRYIYPDSTPAANFSYKTGSYWIYRDSLTGQTDSFYFATTGRQQWSSMVHTGPGMRIQNTS